MRNYYYTLTALIWIIILSGCGKSQEKEVLERNNKAIHAEKLKELRIQDSTSFEKAKVLYENQDWDDALSAFQSIYLTEDFKNASQEYIQQIITRPWQESYGYIHATVQGKFSNSATKDSPLWVEMKFDKKGSIYLYMYEYAYSKPENQSAEKPMYDFSLYVSGNTNEYLCYKVRPNDSYYVNDATHSEGIRLSGSLAYKVRDMLTKSANQVYFSITMGSSSSYTFYINPIGFAKAYELLK